MRAASEASRNGDEYSRAASEASRTVVNIRGRRAMRADAMRSMDAERRDKRGYVGRETRLAGFFYSR